MYTHCPNCDTHFEITQEYLDIAHGKVRCGQCDHVFNALENLYNNDTSELKNEPAGTNDDSATDNQSKNINVSIPNIDIKEKMERIVASLSAATEELKNARKNTTFHPSVRKELPEQNKQALTGKPLVDKELEQIEDTLLADELFQIEEALDVKETIPDEEDLATEESAIVEEVLEVEDAIADKETLETEDTAPATDASDIEIAITEEVLEVENAIADKETLETEDTAPATDTSDIGIAITEEVLEVENAIADKETLETEQTAPAEDVLDIETAVPEDDILEITDTPPPLEDKDELEIVDFNEDVSIPTHSPSPLDFNTANVDQSDIEILNSLMDTSEETISNKKLHDELDEINKTLSDENKSLDNEFSSLDDEFEHLDNGDDLLAELEQLESDFLNNTAISKAPDSDKTPTDNNFHENYLTPAKDNSLDEFYTSRTSFEEKAGVGEKYDTKSDPVEIESTEPHAHEDIAPSFLTQNDSAASTPATILGWLGATIILLVVLASQYIHFNSIKLSQDPGVRPLLESLCPLTGCSLPLLKTPEKIVTVTHDVRTHPTVNNALEIHLTFKNKAAYTQSFPVLGITFSNSVGEVIARRKFLPYEYMKKDSYYTSGIKSNQSQEINLKIVDPDPGSLLSFQFNYL